MPPTTARAFALVLMIVAIILAAGLPHPMIRTGLVTIVLAVAWGILSYAARRGAFTPASGWVQSDRRVNQELRTLTQQMLFYVREVNVLEQRLSAGRGDRAKNEERLAQIESEMNELVRRMVRVRVPSS